MNDHVASDIKTAAIAANLTALHSLLTQATAMAAEGCDRISQDERDGAIGAVLDFESLLEEAKALYAAVIVLHRSRVL